MLFVGWFSCPPAVSDDPVVQVQLQFSSIKLYVFHGLHGCKHLLWCMQPVDVFFSLVRLEHWTHWLLFLTNCKSLTHLLKSKLCKNRSCCFGFIAVPIAQSVSNIIQIIKDVTCLCRIVQNKSLKRNPIESFMLWIGQYIPNSLKLWSDDTCTKC